MALIKRKVVDRITILEDGQVEVREVTRIMEDGKELSHSFHRRVIHPGQDVTNEDSKIRGIVALIHTPEAISDYQAANASRIET